MRVQYVVNEERNGEDRSHDYQPVVQTDMLDEDSSTIHPLEMSAGGLLLDDRRRTIPQSHGGGCNQQQNAGDGQEYRLP